MDWLIANKEWFFSGGGIFLITMLVKYFGNKDKPQPAIQNRDNNGVQANNNGNNNTQIFQQFGPVMPVENKPILPEDDKSFDFSKLKSQTRILFIDDNDFPVVKNLKKAGWITDLINDVHDIDDASIVASHILFVDIHGVAKSLSEEEGIGLVKALKNKYGNAKKVIIYSSDEEGNRFSQAFRIADDFLPKHSDYYEFLAIVEKYAKEIFGN